MISQAESGLTEAQYNALVADNGDFAAYTLTAQKYNLDFEARTASSDVSSNDDVDFDVVLYNGNFYRLSGLQFEKYVPGTDTWTLRSTLTAPEAMVSGKRPSLVMNGSTFTVYMVTRLGLVTATSSNETSWSAWSNIYGTVTYGFSTDLTNGTDAYASASTQVSGSEADQAFDDNNSTGWRSTTTTGWIRWDFGGYTSDKAITRYTIIGVAGQPTNAPKDWTLESSPNGTDWTVIHTVTNQTGWTAAERRTFTVTTSWPTYAERRYWRINVSAINGGSLCTIIEIELMETTGTGLDVIGEVAAATWDRVHVLYVDTAKFVYNPRVLTYSGSWTATLSDIWWSFDPTMFVVATLNSVDVIAIASLTPGTLAVSSVNNVATSNFFTSGGVVVFKYQNGSWSDHIEVDIVDDVRSYRYRDNVRIAALSDRFIITAYGSNGPEGFPFEAYRYYTSKDGRFWSRGHILPTEETVGGFGMQLAASGDYIYGFERKNAYRSLGTPVVGMAPSAGYVDLTDYVDSLSTRHDGAFLLDVILDNADGALTDHAVFNTNNMLQLTLKTGAWVDISGTLTKLVIPTAIVYVDSIDRQSEVPGAFFRVTARDSLSFLTDYASAEDARYWKGQITGGDNFADSTTTTYGGLAHTAIVKGGFRTASNYLETTLDDKESVAFSTFAIDLWNFTLRMGFRFTTSDSSPEQKLGVVFRAADYNNAYIVRYERGDDKIMLFQRRSGSDSLITQSSAMSWTSTSVYRFLLIVAYYGTLRVYTSSESTLGANDAGNPWTLSLEYVFDYSAYQSGRYDTGPKLVSACALERGQVGYYVKADLN